jgi:hypothetical protein
MLDRLSAAFLYLCVALDAMPSSCVCVVAVRLLAHTCGPSVPIFVNKVRRLFEGSALLIILLSLAALKRVNTVMRISVVAKQFYSWGGGGGVIFL